MNILILFPNNSCAQHVAAKLLESGHTVKLYCPNESDSSKATKILQNLLIIAAEQTRIRGGTTARLSTYSGEEFQDFELLVIPYLDVLPKKTDHEFATMVKHTFGMMKEKGCLIPPTCKIVFGGNYGGMLSANEWGNIWPETRGNIFVTCSVYLASQKVKGPDSQDRGFPVSRHNKILFSGDDIKEIVGMRGGWSLDSYSSLEQKAMWDIIQPLTRNESLEDSGVEMVGQFIDVKLAAEYKVPANKPIWFPTEVEDLPWFNSFLPLLRKEIEQSEVSEKGD